MAVKRDTPLRLAGATTRLGSSAIRDLLAVTEQPHIISLAGGLPASDSFPVAAIAEVTAELLATDPAGALQYAATAGHAPLREWAADRHGASPDEVVVTHGSQQALELVTRALVEPGDQVAVADPAYVGALQAFRLAGADLLGVPGDADGLRVDVLADRLRAGARPVLVYVVADFDNPTGATLAGERRTALADLADHYGFMVVEDDPYGELRWAGTRHPRLATMTDRAVTLGSTSKILCPGLRVGWAVAPPALAATLVLLKQAADLQTATLAQRIAHGVLTRPGFLGPHLAGLRARYQAQGAALADALETEVGDALTFARPEGGMFLWARLAGHDTRALLADALAAGVAFVPGAEFAVGAGGGGDCLRLSFATAGPDELRRAARRLAAAIAAKSSSAV